ncbi:MAG: 16S rRNA (uracil(1498)-N(3))-methyltransferase [Wenzhouxiangella sp.]|jgi:16S rRNA (uracil1498-N3)-methyltransferase|nr:16S rRNA (uracil(1498)-N(3))-methyltransferase [Wenzhouxiangella sp.]
MRAIRSYVDQPLSGGEETCLPQRAARHLVRVLRLQAGAAVVLFNGDGAQYPAEIIETDGRDHCRVRLGTAEYPAVESAIATTLVQAIGKGDRMDFSIQKTTELGVTRIQPLMSERTEVRLSGQRLERRLDHWKAVAISAAEQCGRVKVPEIAQPVTLADLALDTDLKLVMDPLAERMPRDLDAPKPSSFSVVVGPEGGFSPSEIETLDSQGCAFVSLGARILRTETAGPAMLVILQTRFGDWS